MDAVVSPILAPPAAEMRNGVSGGAGVNFSAIRPDEVRVMYDQALDKDAQVVVLAELTCSTPKDIREFLGLEARIPIPKKYERDWDKQAAMEMVHDGWSDADIAQAVGASVSAVRSWRWRNGMIKTEKKPKTVRPEEDELFAMHAAGMSDSQIAQTVGWKYQRVQKWRVRNNLPINKSKRGPSKVKVTDEMARPFYDMGMNDREIAHQIGQ